MIELKQNMASINYTNTARRWVTYLSFDSFNIYTVIVAFFHDVVSIMVLKDNDWYEQPSCHINSFKPTMIIENHQQGK